MPRRGGVSRFMNASSRSAVPAASRDWSIDQTSVNKSGRNPRRLPHDPSTRNRGRHHHRRRRPRRHRPRDRPRPARRRLHPWWSATPRPQPIPKGQNLTQRTMEHFPLLGRREGAARGTDDSAGLRHRRHDQLRGRCSASTTTTGCSANSYGPSTSPTTSACRNTRRRRCCAAAWRNFRRCGRCTAPRRRRWRRMRRACRSPWRSVTAAAGRSCAAAMSSAATARGPSCGMLSASPRPAPTMTG
jgi:hypothetical protein